MTAGEASLGDSSLGRLVDVCEAPESLTENMSSSRNAPGAVSWTCSRWIICERPSHLFCFWFWSASLVFATWHNHRQIKASTTCARIDCLESSRLMFANLLLQLGIGEVLHMFAWRNSYQRGLRWFIGAKKRWRSEGSRNRLAYRFDFLSILGWKNRMLDPGDSECDSNAQRFCDSKFKKGNQLH